MKIWPKLAEIWLERCCCRSCSKFVESPEINRAVQRAVNATRRCDTMAWNHCLTDQNPMRNGGDMVWEAYVYGGYHSIVDEQGWNSVSSWYVEGRLWIASCWRINEGNWPRTCWYIAWTVFPELSHQQKIPSCKGIRLALVKRLLPTESPVKLLSIDAWLKLIGAGMDEIWHYQTHLIPDLICDTHCISTSHTTASYPS